MGDGQGQNITHAWFMIDPACTVHQYSTYYSSTEVQYTGWQQEGWQPISFKLCKYHPFAVTKNLLCSAYYNF